MVGRLIKTLICLILLMTAIDAASFGTARAQSFDVALEHCRSTVGFPIVHSCMIGKRGIGSREANLEECRTHARPEVMRCVQAAMEHGRSPASVAGRHEDRKPAGSPERTTSTAKPKTTPDHQHTEIAPASSQPTAIAAPKLTQPPLATPPFGRRVALLIGNGDYKHVPRLPNATNDAKALAAALTASGFQSVTLKTDLTREETIAALRDFSRLADTADWAVVYYSGHGIEYRGTNYIIPTDARLSVDRDIDLETVDVGKLMSVVERAKRLHLIILDACRNNPFLEQMKRTIASRGVSRGLAPAEPDAGSLIVYSAKHGETALDGEGSNSPFATALLARIQTPNLEIRRLFDLVRDDVLASTNKQQQPFTYGSLSGSEDFYFTTR